MGGVAVKRKTSRRRPSRATRARLGYFTGLIVAAVGLGLALGVGWGLFLGGCGTVAAFVWLYDVDDPDLSDAEEVRFR